MANPNEVWERCSRRSSGCAATWPAPDWMYDRRLKCVASSIPLARETDARAAMAEALPTSYSVETLPARRRACGR